MDAFIFRFKMLVKSYDWSDDTKCLALSNLLTGDSLRVLQTLSLEQQNYNYLKQAFLKKFLCTAADYNNKFRNAIPLPSEDADAFISRLEMVFDRCHSIKPLANVGVSKTNGRKQDETKEQENRQSRRDKWHHQHIDGPRAQSCGPPRFRENSWTAPPDKCISGTNLHPREVTEVIVGETRTVIIHSADSPEVHIRFITTVTTRLQIVNMPHPHRL